MGITFIIILNISMHAWNRGKTDIQYLSYILIFIQYRLGNMVYIIG